MNFSTSVEAGDRRSIYTTVTARADSVTAWIIFVNYLFADTPAVIIGLDIEWKPNLTAGADENRVATLQICAGNRCLIIQLLYLDYIPLELIQFLNHPRYLFAGVEIAGDADKLYRHYRLRCDRLYDLRVVALERFPEKLSRFPGLKALARTVAGLELEKPKDISISDWSVRMLSKEQVDYGCLDAYASCRVGVILFFGQPWASNPTSDTRS